MLNNFTIEDIHKIRFENYEKIKDLSHKEIIDKTKREAASGWERLEKLKAARVNK